MAYIFVKIDNTRVNDACSLQISHVSEIQLSHFYMQYSVKSIHKKETFFLAADGESKQLVIQFQIAKKRRNPHRVSDYFANHANMNHTVNSLVPESIFAQTFSVNNYLELYLTHKDTLFSDNSTKKFYFQLIQPSLVPGILNPPPPIFIDVMGNMMNFENPIISVPEGQVVEGVSMDLTEEGGAKKGKDLDDDSEPVVSTATNR